MTQWADQVYAKIERKMPFSVRAAAAEKVIPYQGKGDRWLGPPHERAAWWTNGFWSAMMWQLFNATGDTMYQEEARRVQTMITPELSYYLNLHHDVGFQYLLSCGTDYKLTGDLEARRYTLHAAGLLAGRYNPNGFIRAWNGPTQQGWAIVDCMMNLPLLYWASRETDDPRFALIAKLHADTSIKYFVRPDGSCNHIVIFDPNTGEMLDAPGGQGYAPGTSWSRGQAWALYGFVLSYLGTKEARYLDTAKRIAAYFMQNIRKDWLTDCDFRQPPEEERIDNIAGACAACGLLELAKVTEGQEAQTYHDAALRMLTALDTLSANWDETQCGILQQCTAAYHDDGAGRHINIVYGDYFFIEAVCKLRGTDIMTWKPQEA